MDYSGFEFDESKLSTFCKGILDINKNSQSLIYIVNLCSPRWKIINSMGT